MFELQVVTFCDHSLIADNALLNSCREYGLPLHVLQPDTAWTSNAIKLRLLWEFVNSKALDDSCLLLVSDAFDVIISDNKDSIIKKYLEIDADIVFSAEANFYFRNPHLNYFYWKHYPRSSTLYHFLNSGNYMGSVKSIRSLLAAIFKKYKVDPNNSEQLTAIRSDQYLLSRFYVDSSYESHKLPFTIKLDHQQSLFACTAGRMFETDDIPNHWIESFYFFRYQRFMYKYLGLQDLQVKCADIRLNNHKLKNIRTNTSPAVIHIAGSRKAFKCALDYLNNGNGVDKNKLFSTIPMIINKLARTGSSVTRRIIEYVNDGDYSAEDLFRYSNQHSSQFLEAGEKIVSRLEQKSPVAFAHFNDGEIDFISHYVSNKTSELWTGRRQHKYEPFLGEALHQAITYSSSHYFRGIPCSLCHTKLRSIAEDVIDNDDSIVPAMTIHHNLPLMPRLLTALEGRELWFMANPRQDLSFFEKKGLEVNRNRILRLPFQNSHREFKRLKSMQFPDDAVVIMTCGMIGKILMPIWIENNPNTSFLALGSSLDDHIQSQYRFRLFPKILPMTKNLYGSKPFLFGPKKHCPECYPDVEKHNLVQ